MKRRLLVLLVYTVAATAEYETTTPQPEFTTDSNNNIIGVASIAGITTRNGRVSSLGGIKFYPGSGSMTISNGDRFFYPLTVSAEKDGKYASGTVQIYPGFVSSSARAGYVPQNQQRTYFNDMFLQPTQDLFETARNFDPWFPKDVFKNFSPQRMDVVRNGWLYPSFNPFMNYWR